MLSLGVLILILSLEITARLYLFGWAGLDLRRVPITRGLTPPGLWEDRSESGTLRFVPNLDVFANLVRLQTNSRGLRDREYTLDKPEGAFRVAVMGSSFTLPSGVEIERAFHSLLEERLTAQRSPTTFEFINFATIVMGPGEVLDRLRRSALRYDPDLIIVSATRAVIPYYLLEWRGSPAGLDRKYRWPPPEMVNFRSPSQGTGFRSYFLDQWKSRSASMRNDPPRLPVRMKPPPTRSRPNDVVTKFGGISRKTGIPIVIARLEYDQRVRTPVESRFAARVIDEGMYYVNTLEAFQGTTPREFWVHRLDRHPNARAHAIFADVLEEFLKRNQLLGE